MEGGILLEVGWKGAMIDASPKARWSAKRLWRRQGTSSEVQGGDTVLLFLGWRTPEVAEAEAEVKN